MYITTLKETNINLQIHTDTKAGPERMDTLHRSEITFVVLSSLKTENMRPINPSSII